MTYLKLLLVAFAFIFINSCSSAASNNTPQDIFFTSLKTFCGQYLLGRVVSDDEIDADWRKQVLGVGPVSCQENEIKLPLTVGVDSSRIWIITKNKDSLTLKHDHRHDDGTPNLISHYGGTTKTIGTESRQEFPVDPFSIDLFRREGLEASTSNTWAFEVIPDTSIAYELSRLAVDGKKRFFRAELEHSRLSDLAGE